MRDMRGEGVMCVMRVIRVMRVMYEKGVMRVMCATREMRVMRVTRAPRVYFVGVVLQKGVVAHQALIRGHCITFWLIVPSLQVASSFACSVASLSLSPDY